MMEKLLPQNIEAECGVLGSVIIDPDAISRVEDFLLSEDFYREAHRAIYAAIQVIIDRREPPDFITICDELERAGKLDEVGGASYITSLINQVPTSGNAEYYGRIVERTAILRRLIYAAGQIAAMAYESNDAVPVLEKAESLIFQIARRSARTEAESLVQLSNAYMDDLEMLYTRRDSIIGVPTCYTDLDEITGGLQKANLIILAARPKVGKTSFALNIARNAAKRGFRIGIFSLEMSKKELMGRLMSMEADIDSQYLRSGRIADFEWDRLVTANDTLSALPIWIDDTAGLSTGQLRSRARRMVAEHGIDLLIVDYLGLMQARSESGKRYDNEVQETTEISHALKALAKELNIPVLALCQLSRAVESRQSKVPQLSDLRMSGSIEQDADVVMFLYRDELYNEEAVTGATQVIVAAHRNGPIGDIDVHFDARHTRFTDEVIA